MKLISYKIAVDAGFAPNPFFGILTLATCKPGIRRARRQKGDWIAGFSSKQLNGDAVGHERLVFLMQVTNVIDQFKYYDYPGSRAKIPDLTHEQFVFHAGDNIYRPLTSHPRSCNDFEQVRNRNHWDFENDRENLKQKEHDLSGKNVLASNNFYYFGKYPIVIPEEIRPLVPKGQSAYGYETRDVDRASGFIAFIVQNYKPGIHHPPHKWKNGDESWRLV